MTGTSDTETKKTQKIFILVTGERACRSIIHILGPLSYPGTQHRTWFEDGEEANSLIEDELPSSPPESDAACFVMQHVFLSIQPWSFYSDLAIHSSSNCPVTHYIHFCAPCPTPNPRGPTTYSSHCCSDQVTRF